MKRLQFLLLFPLILLFVGFSGIPDTEAAATLRTIPNGPEPLTEEAGWKPIPQNHLLLVDPDFTLRLQPVD